MIRRIFMLAGIFVFLLPYARADEVSKRTKIEEMFTVLKMDTMMKQMMNQGLAQGKELGKSMMGDTPMTEADQKIMDDYTAKVVALVSDRLSWEKLKPAYIDLYASTYTEEEVDGILVFYKSSIGQALLSRTPELITKSSAIVSAHTQDLGPRMQELMVDLKKRLQAAHPERAQAK